MGHQAPSFATCSLENKALASAPRIKKQSGNGWRKEVPCKNGPHLHPSSQRFGWFARPHRSPKNPTLPLKQPAMKPPRRKRPRRVKATMGHRPKSKRPQTRQITRLPMWSRPQPNLPKPALKETRTKKKRQRVMKRRQRLRRLLKKGPRLGLGARFWRFRASPWEP